MDVTWGTAFEEMKMEAMARSQRQKPATNQLPLRRMKASGSQELAGRVTGAQIACRFRG